jgi:hypothetical protein
VYASGSADRFFKFNSVELVGDSPSRAGRPSFNLVGRDHASRRCLSSQAARYSPSYNFGMPPVSFVGRFALRLRSGSTTILGEEYANTAGCGAKWPARFTCRPIA